MLRSFEQERRGNVELLDGRDGAELDELETVLDDRALQTLLERLREEDDRR